MTRRLLLISGGLLLVLAVAGAIIWFSSPDDQGLQRTHVARALQFDPPMQPDAVGPIRVRFICPQRPEPSPVTVSVMYMGHPNETGRPYANETGEILLDPVHATGRQGEVIAVRAQAMDRRVRMLVDKPFGADVSVRGENGLFGTRYVFPGDDMTGVIEVGCAAERLR